MRLSIGDLGRRTGATVQTIRYKILNKKIKYVRQNIEKLTLILQDLERMKTGCSLRNQKCYVMQSLESHAYCISEHS